MINPEIRPTLVMILPRGEAIRNFVYSGIATDLRKRYRLVFFAIIPNQEIEDLLRGNCDEFHELGAKPNLRYKTRLLLDQIDLAHNKYLWSEAAKLRWQLRDTEASGKRANTVDEHSKELAEERYISGFRARIQIKIKKAVAKLTASATILNKLDNVLDFFAKREPQVQYYQKVLRSISPTLVFNTSHVHALNAYPIMQAARQEGIATASFLFSWDNLTSQGRVFPRPDYYFSWNAKIKQQLLDIYPEVTDSQVLITGTPQFLFHFNPDNFVPRHTFLKQLGLKAHERYVLYSVGLSHNVPFEDVVAERIADMLPKVDSSLRLVIRTYAKDPTTAFERLASRRPDIIIPPVSWVSNFQTPTYQDQIFYTNLLLHASIGINVGSTISLELAMFDKPVIYVGYDPPGKDIAPISYKKLLAFDHLIPILASGAFAFGNSEQEMLHWIREYNKDGSLMRAERKQLIEDFFDLDPGSNSKLRTSDQILDALASVVEQSQN